jgi:TatA/E family protein of Tat protein translocase
VPTSGSPPQAPCTCRDSPAWPDQSVDLQGRKSVVRYFSEFSNRPQHARRAGNDLILIVVVLLFGAKTLPELARGLGQSLGEFKNAQDEFERELSNFAAEVEVKHGDHNLLWSG